MDKNKKDWGSILFDFALAIGVQFVLVKILGFVFERFIITDSFITMATQSGSVTSSLPFIIRLGEWERLFFCFLRDELFLGFLLCLWFAWGVWEKGKVILLQAVILTTLFSVAIMFFSGVSDINRRIVIFFMECAPLMAVFGSGSNGWRFDKWKRIKYNEEGEFKRGVRLVQAGDGAEAMEALAENELPADGKPGVSILEGKPFPFRRENQHFLIIGSPGAGKTQIIYPMIEQVYKRGDKAIIWDVKGSFIQAFAGQEGVDLLAAWDKRSIHWSPGADIRSQLDCQMVSAVMFPPNPKESQPFFLNSARQILEAIFLYLDFQGDDWGWGDVWAILSKEKKEIAALLSTFEDGKAVANILNGDSKSAEDVYSTLISHAQQTIRWYAKAWPKGGISLRKWVHSNSRLLIIGGIPERVDLAKATANIAIEAILNEILSLPDDPNRRIWLFLDELATLGKLEALLNGFSLGRSKGLCVVAGIQDMGKVEHHYGIPLARSIANTFSTLIVLRCSDNDTAQWASKVLGEQEVMITQQSTGKSSQGFMEKSTSTRSEHKQLKTRTLFLPSQISHFNNLSGVIRISGWPLIPAYWTYKAIPQEKLLVDEADWLKKKGKSFERPIDPPMGPGTDSSWRLEE